MPVVDGRNGTAVRRERRYLYWPETVNGCRSAGGIRLSWLSQLLLMHTREYNVGCNHNPKGKITHKGYLDEYPDDCKPRQYEREHIQQIHCASPLAAANPSRLHAKSNRSTGEHQSFQNHYFRIPASMT